METCTEEIVGKKYKLEIHTDEDGESPRDWDNVGDMICFAKGYTLGDKHNYCHPREFLEAALSNSMSYKDGEVDEWSFEDFIVAIKKHDFILPLYLYDHSGITMRTSPFSCRWDSGQVGWIYCSRKDAMKRWGNPSGECGTDIEGEWAKKIYACLESEVAVYDQYLTGDVYGFILYEKVTEDDEEDWVEIDSCWNFYGDDWLKNGMSENMETQVIEDLKNGK